MINVRVKTKTVLESETHEILMQNIIRTRKNSMSCVKLPEKVQTHITVVAYSDLKNIEETVISGTKDSLTGANTTANAVEMPQTENEKHGRKDQSHALWIRTS